MANHLVNSTSPYLLQHADNPVDWYPWGAEALEKARQEDKPIFLSIGYSACHWCHVMAHESFEDAETAALLNRHFVSIKVDREERPDLDRIYMAAVQAMTGNGGWPMSVFLFPDGRPFYGGTYFPPEPRYGMPSFSDLLSSIADAWQRRRQDLEHNGAQLLGVLQQRAETEAQIKSQTPARQALEEAMRRLQAGFDEVHGGWGQAPKFPQPMLIEFLLRAYVEHGDETALSMASHTLDRMAQGGIYDQLGGGFHRYTVDGIWLVPHFEKMLYDNAQLARVYLHAWQITAKPLYRAVVEETLAWVVREMRDPAGGFYAAQDADSPGGEGAYYVWTPGEIERVLGARADAFAQAYDVSEEGNWEGQSILHLVDEERRLALAEARDELLAARQQRPRPHTDDKVIAAWNGMLVAALAEAGKALQRPDLVAAAEETAAFVLANMRSSDGALLRSWRQGEARHDGYLEDYAQIIDGLLALYQATLDVTWFAEARRLLDHVSDHFGAEVGFYDTGDQHEALIVRPRELQDNATPSGNALMVSVLQRMAHLDQNPALEREARAGLEPMHDLIGQHPLAFGQWLLDLQLSLSSANTVVIAGPRNDPRTERLLEAADAGYHPFTQLAWRDATVPEGAPQTLLDLPDVGEPAAHVCTHHQCHPPVTSPDELRRLLG